jgi:uncharacterized protein YceK
MNFLFLTMIVLFCLVGCAGIQSQTDVDSDFQLISFSQGRMTERDGHWVIYEESEDLNFEENGECIFNHEAKPCMWHGYILKYDSHGEDVDLECKGYQNISADFGNPNELIEENTQDFDYVISLKGRERTFVNPQYITGGFSENILKSSTICSIGGVPVLKFKQIVRFEHRSVKS